MIAGVSYNVFNAHEHLIPSLKSIRPAVEYVNVVVQWVSNQNNPADDDLNNTIYEAISRGLVDELVIYWPDFTLDASENELKKRSLGLEKAKRAGVSHFMTMDADEYYVLSEFLSARKFIETNSIVASAVATYLHIKRPIWRSRLPDTTCCSFLTAITSKTHIQHGGPYPVLVDPTRRIRGTDQPFHFFDTKVISMRHMNLVRRHGLAGKIANSTNAHMTDFMGKVRSAYEQWEFGQDLYFPNKPPMEIIEVPDQFEINHIFSD